MRKPRARSARDEVTPISDVRGSDAYRRQLVENLFAKCFHDLTPAPAAGVNSPRCPRSENRCRTNRPSAM